MNYEELEEALDELFPKGFTIETDNHGQLVIYTGLMEDENEEGELIPCDLEEDEEVDPDLDPLDDDDLDDDE